MTSSILFAGGEDFTLTQNGANAIAAANGSLTWGIDTTAGRFRAGYARYAISWNSSGNAVTGTFLRNLNAFASSSFWLSFRNFETGSQASTNSQPFIRFADSTGVVRLRVRWNAANYGGTIVLEKLDAAASVTTLVTSTAGLGTTFGGNVVIDKIDVFVNYAVSGTFSVYSNGNLVVTYSGDVTTNSITSLSYFDIGPGQPTQNSSAISCVSEIIVATRDTRNFSLVTQAASGNGNAHTWDQGTAANSAQNYTPTAQAAPQFASSAGLIQEYTVTPAIPAGNFSVISVVQTAQATIGTSGPTKFDFMVRTSSTDYTSTPDVAPTLAWALYVYAWDTNPNTSAAWLTSELPASSSSFNMGLKSVA